MDNELEIVKQLVLTPEVFHRVKDVSGTELQKQAALREEFPAALVRMALLLNDLRTRAQGKFSRAEEMWFDRTGLEQSTAEIVAKHKAKRFSQSTRRIFDLCGGIGSDSIAMASTGRDVTHIDLSPVMGHRAFLNAAVYGVADKVKIETADATTLDYTEALVHIDPDRRAGKQRALKLEDYSPPLEFLLQLQQQSAGGAFKLSPASNFGGKFNHCEIELISLDGECKEATVWYGELAGEAAMRATVLPSGFSIAGNPWELRPQVGPIGRYVYDPDPAIVRAGLLDLLVEQLPIHRMDDAEEYLTSDELIDCPAVTAFEVLENLPNNERGYRIAIRARGYGDVEVKSRHIPTDAQAIHRKMNLTGAGRATLMIAKVLGKSRALICNRVLKQA
ncbi:THUMP-like domain-containing protein [Planctomicrobium sp. SH668]|uniref:class I SAM-dependent methyltransferase n=1 Tax=Planctomicrobium sp. SH668 TaxID=3448126 RepID=UPI003F5C3374